jgi:AAA+ ATPase superfamily predicted ATPase
MLIVCGSSTSFMENHVLSSEILTKKCIHKQLKIEPFDYLTSAEFFPNWNNYDKALAYGAIGGIPYYLKQLSSYETLEEGIKNSFLNKNGFLIEEPKNLLLRELREPAIYNTIMKSITFGYSSFNKIVTKTQLGSTVVGKYLNTLVSLHFVKRELPVINPTERNGIYKLADNIFKFWYKFVYPNKMSIEQGKSEYLYEEKILPDMNLYMGHIFEDICQQYLIIENRSMRLPFVFDQIGQWWGNNKESKSQEEIDVVATSKRSVIFGECKWTNELVGKELLTDLKRKSRIFEQFDKCYYYLFSKSGFSEGLKQIAQQEDNVKLISLDDIYSVKIKDQNS